MGTQNKGIVAVFDVDETLLQSGRKLKYDVVNAFSRLGKKITPEQVAGDWYKLASDYGLSKEDFDREFDKRKSWLESLKAGEAPLYPDSIPCLETLTEQGVRLVALSKSIPEYTDIKLRYHDLKKYFEAVETVHPKEPNKVQGALNLLGRMTPETLERAYFIGDRPEDVTVADEVSKELKIETIGLYLNRSLKPSPEEVSKYCQIKSLEEIPEIISGGKNGRA
jgi:phosphoglycolate phosphatase-like HAD superfamily hydrolase